jgi:hypothetical protein
LKTKSRADIINYAYKNNLIWILLITKEA